MVVASKNHVYGWHLRCQLQIMRQSHVGEYKNKVAFVFLFKFQGKFLRCAFVIKVFKFDIHIFKRVQPLTFNYANESDS